jgi:hypothetical protein
VPRICCGFGKVGCTNECENPAYLTEDGTRPSHEDAQAVCPSSYGCTRGEVELHEELVNDERRARTRALIGYGVATAALATAAVYYLWAPVKQEESGTAASLTLAPLVGAELAGGVLDVTF